MLWYGPALIWRRETHGSQKQNKGTAKMEKTPLKDRVEQVLTEARVVLPGVQALLGFQLATMLMDGFDKPSTVIEVHSFDKSDSNGALRDPADDTGGLPPNCRTGRGHRELSPVRQPISAIGNDSVASGNLR